MTKVTNILIISASEQNAQLLQHAVKSRTSESEIVIESALGSAFAHMRRNETDVVLFDLRSGINDVMEVRRLKEAFPEVPAIVLSDTHNTQMASQVMGLGAEDFIIQSLFAGEAQFSSLCDYLKNVIDREMLLTGLRRKKRGSPASSSPAAIASA